MENNEILIPITFFLSLFGVLYVYFNTRHKERMSMIEKGADASLFQSKKGYSNASMRFGMFLIGIALGILTGNILTETTSLQEEVSYFSMIFLFGGMSLVSYYMFIERKKGSNWYCREYSWIKIYRGILNFFMKKILYLTI